MSFEEINAFVIEEMGLAEENGENVTIRLNLSDESIIEIWFDEDEDCYTWSNASYGFEDCYTVVSDIMEWLDNNHLKVTDMEVV